jgi:hypothetical protein
VRNRRSTAASLAVIVAACLFADASSTRPVAADDRGNKIAIRDDCDPSDPAWNPTGGCELKKGDVTFAEFNMELESPLAPTSVIGHEAWRNDPPYLEIKEGRPVMVRNRGGRVHTFTEVANFGGGKVPNPFLNKGLVTAPECPGSEDLEPGASGRIEDLAAGNHRFQCCIHPWMRAIVKVKPADGEEDDN